MPSWLSKSAEGSTEKKKELEAEVKYLKNSSFLPILISKLESKLLDIQNKEDKETPESAFNCAWSLANYKGRKSEIKELISLLTLK